MNETKFKKIIDYTQAELDHAIEEAVAHCKKISIVVDSGDRVERVRLDFWTIMKGVDAYMEKRERKITDRMREL